MTRAPMILNLSVPPANPRLAIAVESIRKKDRPESASLEAHQSPRTQTSLGQPPSILTGRFPSTFTTRFHGVPHVPQRPSATMASRMSLPSPWSKTSHALFPRMARRSFRVRISCMFFAITASETANWSVGLNWTNSVPAIAAGVCPGVM
jgi:hypothetical protein